MNQFTKKNPIQKIREESGLSQREWAKKIGVTQSTVCRLENGLQLPSPRVQLAYSAAAKRVVSLREFPASKRAA